jgi:hypothetical protein
MQTSYAYDIVKDMKPYMYRYNQPKDIDTTDDVEVLDQLEKRKKLSVKEFFMGIMADEAPIEILNHENEKSINIYSFATLLLGALQENMKNVEELKEVVRQLGGVI